MSLSADLISQFVKITKDDTETKKESTVYGTTVSYNGSMYVKLDGSELLTPVSTTTKIEAGERVVVMIKKHTATITGNISSPAARVDDIKDMSDVIDKISEFEIVIAKKVDTEDLAAESARIDDLESDNVTIKDSLKAAEGDIDTLQTQYLSVGEKLEADEADISKLKTDKLDATIANAKFATIESLEGTNLKVYNLETTYGTFVVLTTERLDATDAAIEDLRTNKLSAESADLRYANIDFSNIGNAAIEYFYSMSGLIENVVVGDGTITGQLVGVTIRGDLIEGNTIIADKLVIKGEDGLYYKLNTDGVTTESEQTDQNSLNGSVIMAKSITATKISVDDLVAFDATIGGFNITEGSIYSGVKETIDNTTRGVYMDSEGQFYLGDADNFLRYYKDEDGNYKLEISAESILFGSSLKSSLDDLKKLTEHVRIGTHTDPDTGEVNPSIELAEGDSDFKQVITNKSAEFMDGSVTRTRIDADGISTDNVTVKEEWRQGGFVWKIRSNGNLGLVWRGE